MKYTAMLWLLLLFLGGTRAFLLVVPPDLKPGSLLVDASLPELGPRRLYRLAAERSAPFLPQLVHVDALDGRVYLKQPIDCTGSRYPSLFSLHVECVTLGHLGDIPKDFHSLAFRVLLACPVQSERHGSVAAARKWVGDTFASVAVPAWSDAELELAANQRMQELGLEVLARLDVGGPFCLRRSDPIASLTALIPFSVLEHCELRYIDVSDSRFGVESQGGDLVVTQDVCIAEPLWEVRVLLGLGCPPYNTTLGGKLQDCEHRLRVVFHRRGALISLPAPAADKAMNHAAAVLANRVRRELANRAPYFEQALYVASAVEEKPPGLQVAILSAHDPEGAAVTYSMVSLLDSRSQGLFGVDPATGVVTTKAKLDRETIDVHYFRVTATDDSFPPRTGTTTLQVNVQDLNDHAPQFEHAQYEASVREGVSVGSTVITVRATDQDANRNAELEYSLASNNSDEEPAFRIDPKTGVVSTRTTLDREATESYTLLVIAADQAPLPERRSATATLLVRVLDDNDNYPQFSERTYSVWVREDVDFSTNPVVGRVTATDADQGPNAALRYAIIGGNSGGQFAMDSVSGEVALVKPLDYEATRSFRLVLRVQDGGRPARSNTTQLLVNVRDVNDNAPRFYTSLFQESVPESVPVGTSVVRVQAYDADEGNNSAIHYTLGAREEGGGPSKDMPLTVHPDSGWVVTTRPLDREGQARYQFTVIATDSGEPRKSATASVVISIQDVNDNNPVFEPKLYEASISEDAPPGTPVATVTATDRDENPRLHYAISGGNTRGRFGITAQGGRGVVSVAQPLDFKQEKRFILTVTASDSGGKHDEATLYINVTDANNFAPEFENTLYSASVFEDAPISTTVLVVAARDGDAGQNAQITYTIGGAHGAELNDNEETPFAINPQTGAVTTTGTLDRETTGSYLLTVTARDGGVPPLSETTNVEILVADVNDNAPQFRQPSYRANVAEDALVGTSVAQILATDADQGLNGRVRYELKESDGAFSVDATSGVVRTAKPLDRESMSDYELTALAIDRGSPPMTGYATVSVRVEDVNDSPPVFESDRIILYIPENSPVGSTVGEIRASDADDGVNAEIHYSVEGGDDASAFSLVARPGSGVAHLVTMTELDYEGPHKRYDLVVRASSHPLRSDVNVEIHVTDVNDNAPVLKDFQVVFNNFRNCFPAGHIGRIPAHDADVTDKLRYRILSGNNAGLVTLDENTGELTLSPQLNTNVAKTASMELSVSDGVNEIKAGMTLTVRLVTEEMLRNSITVRLAELTAEAFLSPLLGFFTEGLAAIIPCPRENVIVFSIQDDADVSSRILNVSFSARRPDVAAETYYTPQFLQERVYLNRAILARLASVQVLPFDDNLCVREPCLNYERCVSLLQFGNASGFISSNTVLFRPIYPVTTFKCQCPSGFTGSERHYLCDTEVNLCYSSPCQNLGTCERREGGYSCVCMPGFTGANCEIDLALDTCQPGICRSGSTCAPLIKGGFLCENCTPGDHYTRLCELRARSFSKGSYLTFPALRQRHRLSLSLRFATLSPDGLLLYNGRYNEQHDFIALELVGGAVQFSFSLGDQVTRVQAKGASPLGDGNWHTVQVKYHNRTATISVDQCDVALALKHGARLGSQWACANSTQLVLPSKCAPSTASCYRFLDLTGPLQLGGLPALPTAFRVSNKDFVGCLSDLRIDHRFTDLNAYVADKETRPGCPEKHSFCESQPCKHNGKCTEGWATYLCACEEGWSGKDCSESVKTPWHFKGDGLLSFNPLLRPIQLPWSCSLAVRTLQRDASMLSVQVGQNSSAALSLVQGKLNFAYNGAGVSLNSGTVNDGAWHHLEVKWMAGEVWLSLDYGQHEATYPMTAKIQGLYVGKIVIGGPDNPSSLSAFFEGCVQDVRIGGSLSSLARPAVRDNVEDGCGDAETCVVDTCPDNAVCHSGWRQATCTCESGYVGPTCRPVCELSPCANKASCSPQSTSSKGYDCSCASTEYSGDHCEVRLDQPCPASWWGYPVCGPCHCDTARGYNADCDKTSGQCHCKENHYQPIASEECFDCGCYATGSFGSKCDAETGQCKCRNGVIGRRCDSCPNPYAEVTLRGCEVVYDGCPKSFSSGLWWERTVFGKTAIESCPIGSQGKASRVCSEESGWLEADLFNCTSEGFLELRDTLGKLEAEELAINTFVAVKVASELQLASNKSGLLHGADVLVSAQLLQSLLAYETHESGLNLTHSQDKDYIKNIVETASIILQPRYTPHWNRIEQLTSETTADLVTSLDGYLSTLTTNQQDTYTDPFELVSENVVLGLDVITAESLYGYESLGPSLPDLGHDSLLSRERVVLPDTSHFIAPPLEDTNDLLELDEVVGDLDETEATPTTHNTPNSGPTVIFPKYNNYLQRRDKFDTHSQILVPLKLLGIEDVGHGDQASQSSLAPQRAVLSYAQFKTAGELLPARYDATISQRWGVQLQVGSPLLTVAALAGGKKLKGHLPTPVRFRMWLHARPLSPRMNPQCVSWQSQAGLGAWSRAGCHTSLPENWHETPTAAFLINCTCNHLSTFAVLTDVVDLKYVPEPTLLEEIVTWFGFCLALPILLCALIALFLLRGGAQTNSNSIHRNLVLCVFLAELVFFVALKARRAMVQAEVACKLGAIALHYTWLSAFAWSVVDALHLYRMLTEMRDINHGEMKFYYTLGYGLPAVIVGLAVGVRANQYGNYYFCWLSIYETVVWSLVGPVCILVLINLAVLLLAVRAAFTLKDHIMDFGNLRTLLWLAVVSLPLLGLTWVLAVLAASEQQPLLFLLLSLAVVTQALFALLGYCVVNEKVRRSLYVLALRCLGRKTPLADITTVTATSTLGPNTPASQQPRRSALAYHNSRALTASVRRNMGISTSSTTSRSTCKTSSSPYSRSDTHLRHTSTSTSNYNSTSDVPSFLRGFNDSSLPSHEEEGNRRRRNSESSENSEVGPSLELASSHSSDEDEAERRAQESELGVSNVPHYMPNITDPPVSTPRTLNLTSMTAVGFNITTSNSPLFPDLKPMYAPRWSSQLPDAYITSNLRERWSAGQGSTPTVSDNEEGCSQDYTHDDKMAESHENLNDEDDSHRHDRKITVGDKLFFPFTQENSFSSRLGSGGKSSLPLSPINDVNRPPQRSPSPSPLPRLQRNPLSSMASVLAPLTATNISESENTTEINEETSV